MKIKIPSRCMNCQFYETMNEWCYLYDKKIKDATIPKNWCWAGTIELHPRVNGMLGMSKEEAEITLAIYDKDINWGDY